MSLKKTTIIFTIFVMVLVLGAPSGLEGGQVKQELTAYFNQLTENGEFNGSVLIAEKDKVLLMKGFGMADFEKGKVNNPGTVFSIASMSKAFTAMSIMMLEERGLLSVNDPVSDYIPEYPQADQLTIHNLLGMTAGIPNYLATGVIFARIDQLHYPEELLGAVINEPLNFEPGTGWDYCNTCYAALGIIIERVSGMTFREFIKTNILDPLGMCSTSYDPYMEDNQIIRKSAVAYDDITVNPLVHAMFLHPSIGYCAGGMFSNVMDMFKWHRALNSDKLVSYETLEKIYTPGPGNYGYGWWIDTLDINDQPHKNIWHYGAYLGYCSVISQLVDDDLTIILLLNITLPNYSPSYLLDICSDVSAIVLDPSN